MSRAPGDWKNCRRPTLPSWTQQPTPGAVRGPRRAVQSLSKANLDSTWLSKLAFKLNLDCTWPLKIAFQVNFNFDTHLTFELSLALPFEPPQQLPKPTKLHLNVHNSFRFQLYMVASVHRCLCTPLSPDGDACTTSIYIIE